MSWKPWKQLESDVAKALGGLRRVRISYSESCEDVIHHLLAIECKYGKSIPKKAMVGKCCKFLDKAFAQASAYNKDKIPMVCLKKPRMRGFIAITGYPEKTLLTYFHPRACKQVRQRLIPRFRSDG